jgi:hypothetical protein
MSSQGDSSSQKNDSASIGGGCEGPDASYVKLISSDGHEFILKKVFSISSNI